MSDHQESRDDVFDDLLDRVTPESAFQLAVVRQDPGLRCFAHETQGTVHAYDRLPDADKWAYHRPPKVPEDRVAKGTYFRYDWTDPEDPIIVLTSEQAFAQWDTSFEAS